ncbi:MAG: MBL fold metallo-hydrolase [Candidatus Kapabacteria bacterium]|nr:MBL fold metallo-hydrolase [Candidatus Kapabacteria bacterium]
MQIIQIEAGPVATIGYLVLDSKSKSAVIIDAPFESTAYFESVITEKELMVEAILLTHTHWDHIADCSRLAELTKAPVFVNSNDFHRLNNPMEHTIFPLPFKIEAVTEVNFVHDIDKIKVGSLEFEVLFTPGHTEGGICFVEHNEGAVFAGDTLFKESIGRVDLPGGSMPVILESINSKLMVLPDNYVVYSGHGPSTTIGWERVHNPFFS